MVLFLNVFAKFTPLYETTPYDLWCSFHKFDTPRLKKEVKFSFDPSNGFPWNLAEVFALVHPASFMTLYLSAFNLAKGCWGCSAILCAVYQSISMPADFNTNFIPLAIVLLRIGFYGLM